MIFLVGCSSRRGNQWPGLAGDEANTSLALVSIDAISESKSNRDTLIRLEDRLEK